MKSRADAFGFAESEATDAAVVHPSQLEGAALFAAFNVAVRAFDHDVDRAGKFVWSPSK